DILGEDARRRSLVLKVDAWDPPSIVFEGEDGEVPPDIVFLDPPYPAVAEDPVRAAYRAQRLLQRTSPRGVVCFHFRDGQLDVDDFDPTLDVDLRVWGSTAFAFLRRR
ncbi:MAG TPA: hypothetical protein VK081_02040, partial [Planctomycetota bacterium]|nr:hypothetical protein [Planctomycetota bacterium]